MFHNHTLEELVELDFLRPPRTVDPLVFFPSEFETHTPKEISKHVIFMHNYWRWSIPISFLYVLGIFYAQQAMKDRKPVKLKTSLILWNAGLAIFSFWGGFRTAIFMIYDAYHMGWGPTICYTTYNCKGCETAPIWVYLFAYSKVVELGDTLFIVLRKRPLIFLHWYHHVTVLCYTWYAVGTVTAGGTYFIAANFSVHFLMYSYYAIRAAGFNVPRGAQMSLTLCQIAQMIFGIFINIKAFGLKQKLGDACMTSYEGIAVCLLMYASYCVLFSLFFYKTYIKKERQTEVLSPASLINGITALLKKSSFGHFKFSGVAGVISQKTD